MRKLYTAYGLPARPPATAMLRSSSAFSWKAEALLTLADPPFEREYVANIS